MLDNVLINKIETISRCMDRIREEYQNDATSLDNITKQDAIILNLQRACEASIDLAMHLVSKQQLGIPQKSRDAFDMIQKAGVIQVETSEKMKRMVGFRNIAVHDYQSIQTDILLSILDKHLDDFQGFAQEVMQFSNKNS